MNSSSIESIFELVADERDDFSYLIQKYKIDPAFDLQHANLDNVDFGTLSVPTLNLTGCSLIGADLSHVKCGSINLTDADTTRARLPPAMGPGQGDATTRHMWTNILTKVLLSVHRYQPNDVIVSQLMSHISDSMAPIMTFFHSAGEQDYLTKRLYSSFCDTSSGVPDERINPATIICFYTRGLSQGYVGFDPMLADDTFLNLCAMIPERQGIIHDQENESMVEEVARALMKSEVDLNRRRRAFVMAVSSCLSSVNTGILIFSGYPPLSKELYSLMRNQIRARFKLIFLCSHFLEERLIKNQSAWRRYLVPGYAISDPGATPEDVLALARRVRTASSSKVEVGSYMLKELESMMGQPLHKLKAHLIKAIYHANNMRRAKKSRLMPTATITL
jgi:hypothetical protein